MRIAVFVYGVIAYLAFLAAFLYAIGFTGGFIVPKTIDDGVAGSAGAAIFVNVLLLGLFATQHSVMARPAFKKWWSQYVPTEMERSTYVLIASLLLGLLFWQWQPLTGIIWNFDNIVMKVLFYGLFAAGWLTVLLSTFMINHFDLFGLRQVYLHLRNTEYTHLPFIINYFYKFVRHPLMLGFIVAFWATPHMTTGHLLFSIATTAYIFIGIFLEERDLSQHLGDAFTQYQKDVPMIIPNVKRK
jgi:methanethiol S-methyltransferase